MAIDWGWPNLKPDFSLPWSCADDTTDSETEEMPIEDTEQLARSLETTRLKTCVSRGRTADSRLAGNAGDFSRLPVLPDWVHPDGEGRSPAFG